VDQKKVAEAQKMRQANRVVVGTSVLVFEPRACDFGVTCEPALVDGRTQLGSWANMCPNHFKEYGVGLGIGRGQVLIVSETP
jgi:hypothetical protein